MQHILGVILRGNPAELMDDDNHGTNTYSFMGLQAAVSEAQNRLKYNPEILTVNVYRVIQELPGQSKYQLVQEYKRG